MSQNQTPQFFARAADRLILWITPLASPPCGLQSHFRGYYRARNPVVGWKFALAISVLWISSALADPITLKVIAAVPGYNPEGRPSINVTVDDDGGRNLAQFTTAHVGEDIEVRSEGRLLMKARLSTALLGGNIVIISGVGPDENSSLARRLQRDGKIEVEASKRSPQ